MKLCVDCKHHVPGGTPANDSNLDKCGREEAKFPALIDPVNGRVIGQPGRYSCNAMRESFGICGLDKAVLFEQAERTCECGATIGPDERACGSCAEQYRGEERADLDRKFARSEP